MCIICFRSRNCTQLLLNSKSAKKCHQCHDLLEHLGQLQQEFKDSDEVKRELSPLDDDDYIPDEKDDYDYLMEEPEVKLEQKSNTVINFASMDDQVDQKSFTTKRTKTLKKKKTQTKPKKCIYCGEKISQAKFWKHVSEKHNESQDEYNRKHKSFACTAEGCTERFKIPASLIRHARLAHGIKMPITNDGRKVDVECPFCDEKFTSRSQMICPHLEANHVSEKDNPVYIEFYTKHQKTEVCQQCGKLFTNMQSFNYHMRESHPDVISSGEKCEICGKNYKNIMSLKSHMKTHEQCESLCIECGKSFKNKVCLQTHINLHHRNKPVSCPECFKILPNNAKLAKHVRTIHLKQKLHPCNLCDKGFKDRQRLVEHVTAVHHKIKPYLCDFCNFECAKMNNFNLHRKKSHGAENISQTQFVEFVESGKHPYYNQEKIELLKAVVTKQIIDIKI